MSAFGDLFRHFPDKVADLCLDEAFVERRPVYYFDTIDPLIDQRPLCIACGRVAFFEWRDDRWIEHCSPPVPDLRQESCSDQNCARLIEWYSLKGYWGNRRRSAFRKRFGVVWWSGGSEEHATRLALFMLEATLKEKNDAENRRRVA